MKQKQNTKIKSFTAIISLFEDFLEISVNLYNLTSKTQTNL